MSDDAGLALLKAIEAIAVDVREEVRALRKEAREDREARDLLANRKSADAERQARFRQSKKDRESNVTSRDNNVTAGSSLSVVDLGTTTKEDLKIPALRDNHVTSRDKKPRPTAATWVAYTAAYKLRYGVEPVRNATVNSKMAQFVERIGVEESPLVAAFFVQHDSVWYVQKQHSVGILLSEAEPLRTQWVTGKKVTVTDARQRDRTQANIDGWLSVPREKTS